MYIKLIYCDIIKYFRLTITLSDWIYYIYYYVCNIEVYLVI